MKHKIFLADLTHTSLGIHASTFPLGTAFVASYAKKTIGDHFEIRLFKFPNDLCKALGENKPDVLAFSNYSWNLELGYRISILAKKKYPNLVVIFGGPNFPIDRAEKIEFFQSRPAIDFHIQNEGEVAFANLVRKIYEYEFDAPALKKNREILSNCNYLIGSELVEGPVDRIADLNMIPSPYLDGLLDEFFKYPLAPMVETTRGCPFRCAFCADGLISKSRIFKFTDDRVQKELNYIADRIKKVDELIITDLNFGMYDDDVETARAIAELQKERGWPVIVSGSAGKNRPEKVIETISILGGSWKVGSAIQSSDPEVLKNIKRNNISLDAYKRFLDFGNGVSEDATTYTEVILALPGDTKQKHFQSLRYGIENGATSLRMYQAILLSGTDMATQQTRQAYRLKSKFRVIPGGFGAYQFDREFFHVAEIEEIIVATKDMSFDDYVSCRKMNLLIETYLNNALFEEMFAPLNAMGISAFDCLIYLHEHEPMFTPKMREIIESFTFATKFSVYDSYQQAVAYVMQPGIIQKYISGELGANEILVSRAKLYLELEDLVSVLTQAVIELLRERKLFSGQLEDFFRQTSKFILCRKQNFYHCDKMIEADFDYDFDNLSRAKFNTDPRKIQKSLEPIRFKFFHNPAQIKHIENSLNLYANTPSGIGRLIQRSNLKKMYRHFAPERQSEAMVS